MLNNANTAFVVCLVWGAGRMWHKHICRSGRHRGGVLWGGDVHTMSCGGDVHIVHKEAVSTDSRIQMCAPAHCTGNTGKYAEIQGNAQKCKTRNKGKTGNGRN